ncbi:MAG: cellulase family glycosylhydrolase [Nitrospirae bacterium]|nr:cellulase family glycosylhydrolase [Nitrospirota bacterium]
MYIKLVRIVVVAVLMFLSLDANSIACMFGVNLCSAEFGESVLPGTYGTDYTYPTPAELDYYKSKGLMLIRLPFRWERMQQTKGGQLDSAELARMDSFIAAARERGMMVILDLHNFARYYGDIIGSSALPNAVFKDFWAKFAAHYKNESAIYAYGLMNEPHDTGGLWPAAAQAGVDGIRLQDMNHLILVPGENWSAAYTWTTHNNAFNVTDPADNFLYEAHQYFDKDNSGQYKNSYDADGAYPEIGVDRVKVFVNWLKGRNAKGFIGEYGVPYDDSRWLTVLDKFLTYLDENCIGGTYWAGGPWWYNNNSDYKLSVEPKDLSNPQDRPQMSILTKHLKCCTKPKSHDFDGDGKSDIVLQNLKTGETYMWFMSGTTITGGGAPPTTALTWQIKGVGDFDGDGKSDIVLQDITTGQVVIWLMSGSTVKALGSPATVALMWQIKGAGDLDGDGKSDIVFQNVTTGTIYVWLMNGTTIKDMESPATVDPIWQIKGVGDLDGDGKSDIVFQNVTIGTIYAWLMNGTTIKDMGSPATVALMWQIKGVGDLDGDGKSDIVFQNVTTGTIYVWLMNGYTITSSGSPATVDLGWIIRGVSDFDGDGKSDIVFQNLTTGMVYVWLMSGYTTTSSGSPATVDYLTWQIK